MQVLVAFVRFCVIVDNSYGNLDASLLTTTQLDELIFMRTRVQDLYKRQLEFNTRLDIRQI